MSDIIPRPISNFAKSRLTTLLRSYKHMSARNDFSPLSRGVGDKLLAGMINVLYARVSELTRV